MIPRLGGAPGSSRRLALPVAVGTAIGALYAGLDAYLDGRILVGPRLAWLTTAHQIIDLVLPLVTGALIGLTSHTLRLRAEAVAFERRRAEELRGHLNRVERDQAVWVIAASLLHELRNPLHALGLLLDELDAAPDAEGDERRALIQRARAQHDRVTAELRALKALPASEVPALPRVDLAALVGRFVATLSPLARDDRLRIVARATDPVPASADAAYVQIIVENLVENALDALRERGAPGAVEVEVTREGDRAVVRVRDDGPGIDDETAASIFEPLHTTKARGMGLGLSIARALARAMGGDLFLERAHPATFRLELCPATT